MGKDVAETVFSREDRTRYRQKVRRCLDVFERMLAQSRFDADRPMTGTEIELNLIDEHGDPAMANARVLKAIANSDFQTELGQFNIEINIPPRRLAGDAATELEQSIRTSLDDAEARASDEGAHLVMIGILPTVTENHLNGERSPPIPATPCSTNRSSPRAARTCTSRSKASRDCRPTPTRSPRKRRAPVSSSTCRSRLRRLPGHGTQLRPWPCRYAVGANSPFFFGKELWRETRIALFEQATDTRPEELKAQGVRPRVWFGERWITSIFDLFEENVRFFPALLPICETEDPVEVLERGDTPELFELRLHNGTIYRWNRPIYDVVRGRPHLRVENRITPAGPTVADIVANGAFYGLSRYLAEEDRPVWTQLSFAAAGRTSTKARSMALTPMCTGRGSAPFPSANWCYDGYCRSRTRDSSAGMWRLRFATGFSASSSSAASPARTVRPGSQRCSTSCTIGTSIDMRRCAR